MLHFRGPRTALILLSVLAFGAARPALADNLETMLGGVDEAYARAYLAPFTYTLGPNLNSGVYQTAAIPMSGVTVDFGIKVMATHLAAEDQTFQSVIENVNLGDYDPAYAGQTGNIVMSGPTVFGNTKTPGTIAGYVGGVQVFSQNTIEGLVDTRYAPIAVPQASVGGISGLRATVRWLPEIDLGDWGTGKLFGWGVQWSVNSAANTLPIDVMVGFFRQWLDVGTLVASDANSMFVAASKSWSMVTLYGGYGRENSEVSLAYADVASGENVAFTVNDTQERRLTVGVTIDVLARLNVEMAHGDLTTYTAGLMFGF